MKFIFRPGDAAEGAQLGGKAGALAALRGCGLLIPEWFVVLPHALDASLSEADRRALSSDGGLVEAQRIFARIELVPSVTRELNQALAELIPAGELVAVRSSAVDEDGREHSFAGQLESYLSVHPDEVAGKVADVWKSAFSARARAYRELHQLPPTPQSPAVLVQRMIKADAAGVAFGADPVSGRHDLAVVSAVRGLGSTLVNGESDADTWHVDASGRIAMRRVVHQPPALDDAQIRAVAEMARRTSEFFGRPQDIEWAVADGSLYLLQSRPITTMATQGKLNIWDNSNIIESYCGVTTPLTFSFARRAYEGVYRQFCQMLAVPNAKIAAHDQTFRQMLGLIRGRVYYNLLNWYRVLALLPGFTLNRRFMEQMMGVKEELPAEILAELGHASVRARAKDACDLAFSVAALAANHFLLPRKIRQFYNRLNEALAPPQKPLDAMTADELAAYFLGLEKKLLTRWDTPLLNDFFAMIFYGVLRGLMSKWAHDPSGTLQNDLLCGEGGMISAEPARRIRELAQLASADARFTKLLCDGGLPDILARMDELPKFKSAYREYLAKFGERCLEELKLESLTLHDDPMLLLRSVGQLARSASSVADAVKPGGSADQRRSAEARVSQSLAGHPLRRVLFRWVLRHTRARVRDRENLRFERTRLFGRVRRVFVEIGRRLHSAGHLHEPRDVFFLEVDELLGFIAGSAATTKLKALVVLRQSEFAEYRAEPPPPSRFTTQGSSPFLADPLTGHAPQQGSAGFPACGSTGLSSPVFQNRATGKSPEPADRNVRATPNMESVGSGSQLSGSQPVPPDVQGDERQGIGCCPGRVRGRVRKIADPRTAAIHAGEILVAERTDPGWIMLFPAAAGLLVERGSMLSHSAIVARELRLPAIVSISGLTAWLNDGDQIEFDGSTGRVRRIAEAMMPSAIQPSSTTTLSTHVQPALTTSAP